MTNKGNRENGVRPTGVVVHDQFEIEANSLFEQYKSYNSKFGLLLKAADLWEKSSNPEGKKMADLVRGFYYFEAAKAEKNHERAVVLLGKSYEISKKTIGASDIATKRIRFQLLKRKVRAASSLKENPKKEDFFEAAQLSRDLGNESEYHTQMSLYYLFSTYDVSGPDLQKLDEITKQMLFHAEKSGNQDMAYKAKSMYHLIKSASAFNPKDRLRELESVLEATLKTSDRYGEDRAKADIIFAKALTTPKRQERNVLLRQAIAEYQKLGVDDQVKTVSHLLKPDSAFVSKALNDLEETKKSYAKLAKTLQELTQLPSGAYLLFYHHSYLIGRIADIKRILNRLSSTKKELIRLSVDDAAVRPEDWPPGKPYPKELKKISNKHTEATGQMRMDLESLYIFGNLALDQWSHMIAYATGQGNPEDFDFERLYTTLSGKRYSGVLKPLWDNYKADIIWLYFHLRRFRNIFVEHLNKPWQVGTTMSVYGDDFNLFTPAASGSLDESDVRKDLKSIFHLAPKWLKEAPDGYWEKVNLRRVLEVTMMNIDKIDQPGNRNKVRDVWEKVGGSAPSYDLISQRLVRLLKESAPLIEQVVKENPKLINPAGTRLAD